MNFYYTPKARKGSPLQRTIALICIRRLRRVKSCHQAALACRFTDATRQSAQWDIRSHDAWSGSLCTLAMSSSVSGVRLNGRAKVGQNTVPTTSVARPQHGRPLLETTPAASTPCTCMVLSCCWLHLGTHAAPASQPVSVLLAMCSVLQPKPAAAVIAHDQTV